MARRTGKPEYANEHLWVSGETYGDHVEVRELMDSDTVEDHLLAIDALRGWAFNLEDTTHPPRGKNFRDRHHYQNKSARKGCPRAIVGGSYEYTDILRRDIHEKLEAVWGWVGQLSVDEAMSFLEEKEAA